MKNSYTDDLMKTGEFALHSSTKKSTKDEVILPTDANNDDRHQGKQKLGGKKIAKIEE